jgi:hypothetical protein
MMQNSRDCTAVVDDRETTQLADFAGNGIKGYSRESIDGSTTLVSNLSSVEDNSVHLKSNTKPYRIWIILLSIVFAFSVLCLGYWMGWVIGESRNSSNSTTIEIDPLSRPITDSPVWNPTNMPTSKPMISPNAGPKENHPTVSTPHTGALSDSPIQSNVEPGTKPPFGSVTTKDSSVGNPTYMPSLTPEVSPVAVPTENHHTVSPMSAAGALSESPVGSNVKPATNPPTGSKATPVNNIEPPTEPPVELSKSPVTTPSTAPVDAPFISPVNATKSTDQVDKVTYIPGNLTRMQNKLLLSEGLEARIIAETGKRVQYDDGSSSDIKFHIRPDAGATFPDTRWWNNGGWIYVSNSEAKNETEGGVGAITFDKHGSVVHYDMVLENTHMNCGGGRTPWNTWVSCEEVEFTGQIYQVDPTGQRASERMSIGSAGGRWESFAYDIRDKGKPRFFTTEDHNKGCTRRFTPTTTHWGGDEWKMLHEEGVTDYLFVSPNDERTGGTFKWTEDINAAKNNARTFYPQSEGIDIQKGKMYIVCKQIQQLFVFDLDEMTFHNVSTVSGLFDGDPDQMQRILGSEGGLLYFTEEGGQDAGVHA